MDARAWDERYAATELVWSAGPNQFVESELKDLRPGRALDLAAGEGRNAIWLAEQGWEVTAVDFSLVGLDKGRAALAQRPGGRDLHVEWVHADVLDDLRGCSFEVLRAERVSRQVVEDPVSHRAHPARTAYDCLVRLRRTA